LTDLFLGYVIGFGIVSVLIGIGAWRVTVEKNQEYCSDCCNPDHWTPENRAKLTPEQYKTMKENIEKGKVRQ